MYGNPRVSMAEDAGTLATVWLGAPEAAGLFAADALDAAELDRFQRRRARRREEFAVSRALRAHARSASLPVESLSHSGGHAAMLQARAGLRVGVDLEAHRPRDFLAIARATFAAGEAAMLEELGGKQREQAFYALWTLKEASRKRCN
jgi:4'-phosphopantetheinyl transferase